MILLFLGLSSDSLLAQWQMIAEDADVSISVQNADCYGLNIVLFQVESKSSESQDFSLTVDYASVDFNKSVIKDIRSLDADQIKNVDCKEAGASMDMILMLPKDHVFQVSNLTISINR